MLKNQDNFVVQTITNKAKQSGFASFCVKTVINHCVYKAVKVKSKDTNGMFQNAL